MKKTLSLILALLMSVSTAAAVFADEAVAISDTDAAIDEVVATEEDSAYAEAVEFLVDKKIMQGYGDDLGLEDDVNRYQMALFTGRILTGWTDNNAWEDGPLNTSEFTDLEGTPAADYYGALSYVNQMGIIEGYGDGRFGPMNGITYQDALTIVVRSLGYQNLDWPWGYIQKGVELGLTKNIKDVAYTDALTRGETAEIIYQALFTDHKDGYKLAYKTFGVEYGWEDVVIVASNKGVFGVNKTCDSGFVKFQIVEDGALDDTVYLAKAADFGLDTAKHEDESAVGVSFRVLFEKDADSELVSIYKYTPNYVETIWNKGKTDDAGVDQDYAIAEALASDYYVVTKYSTTVLGTSLSNAGSAKELIVFNALGGVRELYKDGVKKIGVDMNTGDIVEYAIDDDGVVTVVDTLWYYNALLEKYYDIVYNADKQEIGVKYMTAADQAELDKALNGVDALKDGFGRPLEAKEIDADTAYASLDVYTAGGNYYGVYEEYKFGYFKMSTNKADCKCDGDPARTSYSITNALWYTAGEAKDILKVDVPATHNMIVDGQCGCGWAWINEDFAANKTADGYAAGYVIYSANEVTGEIKILKHINDCADEDSYTAYGTVTGYSVADESIVINGETYTFNYDNLEGAGIINVTSNGSASKGVYADMLRAYFHQYVHYVVVDGEIVFINITGVKASDLFVVEKYAGISSDGYIVVDGYWTEAATELTRIRVASYNNNYTGDPFYYMNSSKAEAAFTKGSIYYVSSTEVTDGEKYYNVQIVGGPVNGKYTLYNPSSFTTDDYAVAFVDNGVDLASDGYALFDGGLKRNKSMTYILVGESSEDVNSKEYAPIAVWTGKVSNKDWAASGKRLAGSYDAGYLVLVNATWTGFTRDTETTGVVALLNNRYWSADINNAFDADKWYVMGEAKYEVEVFDFFTAGTRDIEITNLNLYVGTIYRTQNGTILYADGASVIKAGDLYDEMVASYGNYNTNADWKSAKYIFSAENGYTVDLTNIDADTMKAQISKQISNIKFGTDKYTDLVSSVTVKAITTDGDRVTKIDTVNADYLKNLAKDKGVDTVALKGFYLYNANGSVIVYVFTDAATSSAAVKGEAIASSTVLAAGKDAYITATGSFDITKTNGSVDTAKLNAVTFTITGDAATKNSHESVETDNFYFGQAGKCKFEDWNCTIDGETVYDASITTKTYEGHDTEEACNLIQTVTITFGKAIELKKDAWVQIDVFFENSYGTDANFCLCGIIENTDTDAELEVNFAMDPNNGTNSYIDFTQVVTSAVLATLHNA